MPYKATVPRTCEQCGTSFLATIRDSDQRFCSPTCWRDSLGSPLEQFWMHVVCDIRTHCHVWTGSANTFGYGVFTSAKADILRKTAHRIAWQWFVGPIPSGLHVLHHCDNPPCVLAHSDPTVSHLFLGTHTDNMRDRNAKGRANMPRGEANGSHKFPERLVRGETHHRATMTEATVRELRRRYASGGITIRNLAAELGVSYDAASQIISRRSWRHIQ